MKKKILSCILAITIAVTMLAGCGSGDSDKKAESSSDGDVELTVFHRFSDGASKEFFDKVAKDFEASHPSVKINMTSADNANYKQEINVKLASNEAPDIYFAWSGVYAQNFADGGRALDLSSYLESDSKWKESIIENQYGPFTFNDKVYGIPIIMDGKTFYYNKEIFEELNLDVPENWDEFMDVLDKISQTNYIPISLGNQEDWATGHYMTTLNQRMVKADTLQSDYALEGDFTDSQYVAALEKLNELTPYFTPDFNSTSYDCFLLGTL